MGPQCNDDQTQAGRRLAAHGSQTFHLPFVILSVLVAKMGKVTLNDIMHKVLCNMSSKKYVLEITVFIS